MNLSRAAKKFKSEDSKRSEAAKPAKSKKHAKPLPSAEQPAVEKPEPVSKPVVASVTPAPEPVVKAAPAPEPEQPSPVKVKRPRFVFVRQKADRRERATLPPLPPPSTKPSARLMTRNLAVPPKDEAKRFGK